MHALRRHSRTALLFVLLSGADLALTCHLLSRGGGDVYEANGLAAAVIERFGLPGLAAFKAAVVLLVLALVCLVSAYRPGAAARCRVAASAGEARRRLVGPRAPAVHREGFSSTGRLAAGVACAVWGGVGEPHAV